MPLAEVRSDSRFAQQLRQGDFFGLQVKLASGIEPVVDTVSVWRSAGEDRGTGWRTTTRRGVAIGKLDAISRQLVNMRRFQLHVSIGLRVSQP